MIRFFLGFFMVFGAIGTEDYAMESGTPLPPIEQTIFLCVVGLLLMYFGTKRMKEVYGDE